MVMGLKGDRLMPKYTDDEIRGMSKITIKVAADYLGISAKVLTIGMRNDLLPIGFATRNERYNKEIELTKEIVNEANDYDTASKIRRYISVLAGKDDISPE
jgi:hypothetical protein